MYARYIPPKKTPTAPVVTPVAAHGGGSRFAPPSWDAPASVPSRPTPPPKRKIVFDDSDDDGAKTAKKPFLMGANGQFLSRDLEIQQAEQESQKKDEGDAEKKKKKKKSKGKKDDAAKEEAPKVEAEENPADEAEREERKRQKKKDRRQAKKELIRTKKNENASGEGPDEDPPEPADQGEGQGDSGGAQNEEADVSMTMTIPPPPTEETNKKKKKKDKKREEVEEAAADGDAGHDGEEHGDAEKVSARHRALLDKKEKSLKKALAAASKKKKKTRRTGGESGSDGDNDSDGNGEGDDDAGGENTPSAPPELHGLEPLPQPAPVAEGAANIAYETLPPWLAQPVYVSAEARRPFSQLGVAPAAKHGIGEAVEKVLRQERGWAEAFAVQTAVIPRLLPGWREPRGPGGGDLVISAATGSGKTLAYVLPIVRDICRNTLDTRLRAVVVVPTRELVKQVQDVCETCTKAFKAGGGRRLRVGVAMGSQSLKKEQAALVKRESAFDPKGYQTGLLQGKAWPVEGGKGGSGGFGGGLGGIAIPQLSDPATFPSPDETFQYSSVVDILITTPGRLVEHIQGTPGFTLDFAQWLVIDEADKLLGQSYQQWLQVVMQELGNRRTLLRGTRGVLGRVRKVILSATMTRDLSLFNSLGLYRPTHIVLEGQGRGHSGGGSGDSTGAGAAEYELPELLHEAAIKVRDEAQKPLYLLDLLSSAYLNGDGGKKVDDDDDDTSESETSSDSDSSSESSDSGDSGDSSESESDSDSAPTTKKSKPTAATATATAFRTTALIFAKSNENALRLSRLIALLAPPDLGELVGTLTSTTRTSDRRKTLRLFAAGKLRILVATDLAGRGIDLPDLDHVINYDMPPSVEFYVHRVGRTARAGRPGHAWTLFTKKEAGWFFPEIAGQRSGSSGSSSGSSGKPCAIRRARKVANISVGGQDGGKTEKGGKSWFSEARIAAYEAALEKLGQEATAAGRKG